MNEKNSVIGNKGNNPNLGNTGRREIREGVETAPRPNFDRPPRPGKKK